MTASVGERAPLAHESWLVMVVTDHGGEGTSHGDMVPGWQTIPFILAGATCLRGEFEVQVSHLDVTPTVLSHFGALDAAWDELQGIARQHVCVRDCAVLGRGRAVRPTFTVLAASR